MKTLPALTEQEQQQVLQGGTPHSELRKALAAQHPIHDEFAKAYQNLGGVVGLTDWAEENKTDFYKLVAKMAPTPQHVQHSGGIKLEMALAPSPLDE